jgi:flagellar basal body-associated protein FliL
MKTNSSARRFVRIRGIVICLALVGMVGIAFWSGASLATRVGQTTAPQTEGPQAPNVNFADLMASAR